MESGEGQNKLGEVIQFEKDGMVNRALKEFGADVQVVGVANEDGSNPRQVFDGSVGIPVEMPQPVKDEDDPEVLGAVKRRDAAIEAAKTRRMNKEAEEHAAQFPDED